MSKEFEEFLRTIKPLQKGVKRLEPEESSPPPRIRKQHPTFTTMPLKESQKTDIQIMKENDQRLARNIASGKTLIESSLDLHTKRYQSAEESVFQFIQRSSQQRMRWVMIITGKGSHGPSVLRAALPDWLNHPRIKGLVIRAMPAHPRDGGEGAFYINLRIPPRKDS